MRENGFTLIELILVVAVIGILASIAVTGLQRSVENHRFTDTVEEMDRLARAIVGDERLVSGGVRMDYGYVGDVGSLPPSLDALVSNPGAYATWDGPYISTDFAEDSLDYKRDAWNNDYVYSGGVTIVSSGGGSTITRRFASSVASLTSNTVRGVVMDGLGAPPGDSALTVSVTISYPDGAGSTTQTTVSPSASGEFQFTGVVPIGVHLVRGVASSTNDTTSKYVAVNPGQNPIVELRFSDNLWAGLAGGTSSYIVYVSGSGQATGGNKDNIRFQIQNTSASQTVTITSLTATYTSSPQGYYKEIKWDGAKIWENANPQNGSGDMASFAAQYVAPGQTVTIELKKFRENPDGSGAKVNMQGVAFTIQFSNGSVINFTVA